MFHLVYHIEGYCYTWSFACKLKGSALVSSEQNILVIYNSSVERVVIFQLENYGLYFNFLLSYMLLVPKASHLTPTCVPISVSMGDRVLISKWGWMKALSLLCESAFSDLYNQKSAV